MFKIAQKPQYTWPVKVDIPGDGGKYTTATFRAKFNALPQSRIDDYFAGRDAGSETDLLSEAVAEVMDLGDETGQPITWSDQVKVQLLDIPYVRAALVRAFFESITGGGAKRKN